MSLKNEIVPSKREKAYLGQIWVGKKRIRRVLIRFADAEKVSPDELQTLLAQRLKELKWDHSLAN